MRDFGGRVCLLQVGLCACYIVWKSDPLDVILKSEIVSREGDEKFISFSLLHFCLFSDISLQPGFPPFLGLSVPAILLLFVSVLFRNIFYQIFSSFYII